VRRGLDGLKPYLIAFISQQGGAVPPPEQRDIAALLKSLLDDWGRFYAKRLPRVARSYVHELLDVRNRWAHEQPFTAADSARALDTVQQLAAAIGAPVSQVSSDASMARGKTTTAKPSGQRAVMREIYGQYRNSESRIIAAYAEAERLGRVQRLGQKSGHSAEEYAKALLADGLRKGWLK
jgi:hypothetical protein